MDMEIKPYPCPKCDLSFFWIRELQLHVKGEHRQYVVNWAVEDLWLDALGET